MLAGFQGGEGAGGGAKVGWGEVAEGVEGVEGEGLGGEEFLGGKAPGRGEVEEFSGADGVVVACELEARRGGSLGKNGERGAVGIYRRSRMASGRKEEGDREGEDSFLHGWKFLYGRERWR